MLALGSVSASNKTMISTINFRDNTTMTDITNTVNDLLAFSVQQSTPNITVGCTGEYALYNEMSAATENNFVLIDGSVVPVAVCILGAALRSYRHMAVAFCTLACSLLLAFCCMLPVSAAIDVDPLTPSIMISLGLAVCFDYNLFLRTRFREERVGRL